MTTVTMTMTIVTMTHPWVLCRKLFQLPALPKHQPELATWQQLAIPSISVHYPVPPQLADGSSHKPGSNAAPSGGGRKKQQQHAESNRPPPEVGCEAEVDGLAYQAHGADLGSRPAGIANSRNAQAPHYRPQGLKPTPVARALAGPTVHILVEGYVRL